MKELELSLMAIDVDGTLGNPIMRVAVVVWAAVLAAPMFLALRRWASVSPRALVGVAVLLFGYLSSPIAHRVIASIIYQISSKPGVSVGFFGRPASFVSPLLSLAIIGVAAFFVRLSPK